MVCSKPKPFLADESFRESVELAGKVDPAVLTLTANLNTLQMLLWRLNSNMEFTNEDLLLGMQVLNENTILALIKAVSVL